MNKNQLDNRFPNIAACKDAMALYENLNLSQLEEIEDSIDEYENLSEEAYRETYEDYPTIIQWYEGCLDTNDLIDFMSNC